MKDEDLKQLDLLSIFHYVLGGIMALFSCIPLLHVFIGLSIISGSFFEKAKNPPPALFGWMFVIIGLVSILFGYTISICILIAGKKLKARKNRVFCIVIAGIECMFMPIGTVLGVFSIIILNKDSIKEIFAQHEDSCDQLSSPKQPDT